MSFNLPLELWYEIFSYLTLEDLAKARAVCKTWWDIINCDILWKPKMVERGISQDCVDAGDVNPKALNNCEWANIYFKYQQAVIRNWALCRPRRTECHPSTECVVICLPYMLKTFDIYNVVDIQRLTNGEFVPWAKIPFPLDNEEGCYEPEMSFNDAFAVSKNSYTMVFKLHDGAFRFEKALAFTESFNLEFCSNESKASNFVQNSYRMVNRAFISCLAVTRDVVWIYENMNHILVVCDYSKSEVKLRLDLSLAPMHSWPYQPLQVHSTEKRIYLLLLDEVTIYTPQGQRLWFYKDKQATSSHFSCNSSGCGFIQKKNLVNCALYYNMSNISLTKLDVLNPVALILDTTGVLAYCLCVQDKSVYLSCASTQTGKLLWESIICQPLKTQIEHLEDYLKMYIILKRYIVILGVTGISENFFSPGHMSVFSCSNGNLIWSYSFHPSKIVHISDNFMVTRGRCPRNGMRYMYEVHNFLRNNQSLKALGIRS